MVKDYEIRESIDELMKDISAYSDNPSTWLQWIIYLLRQMEQRAMDVNPSHQELYDSMLSNLQDSLRNRQKTGGW